MTTILNAIETTGYITKKRQLELDEILPVAGPIPVRIIILYKTITEKTEKEWLQAAISAPAFDFSNRPMELFATVNLREAIPLAPDEIKDAG